MHKETKKNSILIALVLLTTMMVGNTVKLSVPKMVAKAEGTMSCHDSVLEDNRRVAATSVILECSVATALPINGQILIGFPADWDIASIIPSDVILQTPVLSPTITINSGTKSITMTLDGPIASGDSFIIKIGTVNKTITPSTAGSYFIGLTTKNATGTELDIGSSEAIVETNIAPSSLTPTVSSTATSTSTATDTLTNTPSITPSNTPSSTFTHTASPTPSNTVTVLPSFTASSTSTITKTATNISGSVTSTASPTSTATTTGSHSATPTATRTATSTQTFTATTTGSHSATPTATRTATLARTATFTSTATATPSKTSTGSKTVTATPSRTSTPDTGTTIGIGGATGDNNNANTTPTVTILPKSGFEVPPTLPDSLVVLISGIGIIGETIRRRRVNFKK